MTISRSLPSIWLLAAALACAPSAPAHGAVRRVIAAPDLLKPHWSGGLISNVSFTPPANAAPAHTPFFGTLQLTESEMSTEPAVFASHTVLGRDPRMFP